MRRHSRENVPVHKPIHSSAQEDLGFSVGGAAPPPTFASTLAGIFSDACASDPELQQSCQRWQAQVAVLPKEPREVKEQKAPKEPKEKVPKKPKLALTERRQTGFEFHDIVANLPGQQMPILALADAEQEEEEEESEDEAEEEPPLQLEPEMPKKLAPGALRATDVRSYGTLDQLLSSGWKPPTPPPPPPMPVDGESLPFLSQDSLRRGSQRFPGGSRPASSANEIRRGSTKIIRPGSEGLDARRGSTKGRPSLKKMATSEFANRPRSEGGDMARGSVVGRSSVVGRGSVFARGSVVGRSSVVGGPRRSIVARKSLVGRHVGFNEPSESSGSSGFTSSDSETETDSSAERDKELLADIAKPEMSTDWSLMLSFARDNKKSVTAESTDTSPRAQASQDEASALREKRAQEQGQSQAVDSGSPVPELVGRKSIAFQSTSSWRVRGRPRPRSPLRPGVYVGHESAQHAKINQGPAPRSIPGTPRSFASGRFPVIQSVSRPATSGAMVEASQKKPTEDSGGLSIWQQCLLKLEDEGKTDESRAYDAWRKRVVDCTRTMQLEVARFKLEEVG